MKTRVVINACAPSYSSRADEAACFVESCQARTGFGAGPVEVLVLYSDQDTEKEIISCLPFPKINLLRIERYQPELVLQILEEIEDSSAADFYIFPGGYSGNELAVRLAHRLRGTSLVAVEKLTIEDGKVHGTKKVYSGNLEGSFILKKKPCCLSLARGIGRFDKVIPEDQKKVSIRDYSHKPVEPHSRKHLQTPSQGDNSLARASFIILAGRGAGSRQELTRLGTIAREMGAGLGVSRPVAMNAWAPMDLLIGASGSVVSPDICLALAVSGSPPLYYGIAKSKLIIAINRDAQAPIMGAADVVIVDDYRKIIDSLCRLVQEAGKP